MIRCLLLLAAVFFPTSSLAQPQIVVQTHITPVTVMVGQQARLLVDVYFLGSMTHPPRVDMPDIGGVQLFTFSSQGVNMTTNIGGNAYAGQEFEFDLYPRRSGNFKIPPATVTLLDANGNPISTKAGTVQTLTAQTPPGFPDTAPIVASSNVTMDEEFTPSTAHLAVGDSVTRIITRHADGVPGLSFSDLAPPKITGLQAYPDTPVIEDNVNRGDVTGKRVDKVTFIFENPGSFTIPPVSMSWWNTDTGQAETIKVPGYTATILPSGTSINWVIPSCVAALLAAAGAAWFWLRKYRKPRPASPPTQRAAKHMLHDACARVDAKAAYKALIIWRGSRPPIAGNAALSSSIEALERAVFGNTPWRAENAKKLSHDIKTSPGKTARKAKPHLPDLNPGQGGKILKT